MTKQSYITEPQHIQVSFQVPKRPACTATMTIQPDDDPVKSGRHLIGLYDDPSQLKGYPVMLGKVSSPETRAYSSIYGWMQITSANIDPHWVMDPYPPFKDVNTPFVTWGAEPSLVDAPGRVGVENYDWTARSFLTFSPDLCMTKTVVPVLAFEWGFTIKDYKPYVKLMKQLNVVEWNGHLELFRGAFPGWSFQEVEG